MKIPKEMTFGNNLTEEVVPRLTGSGGWGGCFRQEHSGWRSEPGIGRAQEGGCVREELVGDGRHSGGFGLGESRVMTSGCCHCFKVGGVGVNEMTRCLKGKRMRCILRQ